MVHNSSGQSNAIRQVALRSKQRRKRIQIAAWLFLLPAFISFALFKYYPMLQGFHMSLYKWSIIRPPGDYVGLQNFEKVLNDPYFWRAAQNTVELLVVSLVLTFWGPILLAILIDEVKHFRTFFRLVYYLPAVMPGIASIMLWKYVWQPDYGLANSLLESLGMQRQLWLNDPDLAKIAMNLPGLWTVGGLNFLIYLAALQDVPEDWYEAAAIDGANILQRVRYVMLPSIMPTIFAMLLLAVIGGLQQFNVPYIMTQGGPAGSTVTVGMYIYWAAFRDGRYGYAMAAAVILFTVIVVATFIQMRVQAMGNKES